MATFPRCRCGRCGSDTPLESGASEMRCPACGTTYPIEQGVIVLTSAVDERDYPEPLVDLVAGVEGRHFWFAARNDVIVSTLRRTVGIRDGMHVLDVGCGTGFVTAALEQAGLNAVGIDMHRSALSRARMRMRGPLFLSDATTLPFFPDFDVVTLCDVIEHVNDDVGVLKEAARTLVPNGHVVVTVPADARLWTKYDEVIGHKRRYDRQTLLHALEQAGLEVRYAGYFNCLALLGQLAQRRRAAGGDSRGNTLEIVSRTLQVPPQPINTLLRLSVALEAPLRHLRWARGGSLIAIARKHA